MLPGPQTDFKRCMTHERENGGRERKEGRGEEDRHPILRRCCAKGRINHSGGGHTNVKRGPFLIRVARIFSGRALFFSGGALFPP